MAAALAATIVVPHVGMIVSLGLEAFSRQSEKRNLLARLLMGKRKTRDVVIDLVNMTGPDEIIVLIRQVAYEIEKAETSSSSEKSHLDGSPSSRRGAESHGSFVA